MWAIEASPSPKAAYRWGWHHFDSGYTTEGDCIPNLRVNKHWNT